MTYLTDLAAYANSLKEQYEAGQLSAPDYKELIDDLKIADAIQTQATELEEDIIAQQTLNACITLAGAVY
jgi:hypothetical protein